MRIRDPKTTALIFASGKMVCTGAKSEEHSKLAARKVRTIIILFVFIMHADFFCFILVSAFVEFYITSFI